MPARRRELQAEAPGELAGQVEAWARQVSAPRLTEVRRQAASFRQPVACLEVGPCAVVHPEVSWSRRPRPAVVHPDALQAPASQQAQASLALLKARFAQGPSWVRCPADAWRHPVARPSDGDRSVPALPLGQAPWSPQEASPVQRSEASLASLASDAAVAQRPVAEVPALDAVAARQPVAAEVVAPGVAAVLPRVVEEGVAWDAVVLPQAVAAAVLDAAAVPQPAAVEVSDAAAAPQLAAGAVVARGAAEPLSVVRAASVVSLPAAVPSAAPWVFRRGRLLPSPARRPAARSRRGKRISRAASRSERSWQAA